MPNEVMSPTEHQTKRHYWLRDDFEELIRVIPGADFPMPNDANSSSSLVYPKHTKGAVAELKLRGLRCDGALLTRLAEDGIVNPKPMAGSEHILLWDRADIDAAADWLYDNEHWDSWTHFCWASNVRFGQAVKAHRVACARYGLGFNLSFDVLGLVTVIEPATDPDDFAWIRFYPTGTKVEAKETK